MDLEELEIWGCGTAGLDVLGGKIVAPILDPTGSHLSLVGFICDFKSLTNAETTHTHTRKEAGIRENTFWHDMWASLGSYLTSDGFPSPVR